MTLWPAKKVGFFFFLKKEFLVFTYEDTEAQRGK